jgi:hypothetical protein
MAAMSRSSNNDICKAPLSASVLMAGARNAVIQSSPAGAISASRRSCVIIPRSPTSTTCLSAKRLLTMSIWVASVRGSAVLPSNTSNTSNTSIATGQPSAAHNRP